MGGILLDPWNGGDSPPDSIIVVDTIEATASQGELLLSREIVEFAMRGFGEPLQIRVSWGTRPSDGKMVRDLAHETLFVSADRPTEGNLLEPSEYQSNVTADHDGTYGTRVFIESRRSKGIYHALLPSLFLPKSLSFGERTRLVSARKCRDQRLALTFLFDRELEVVSRISEASKRVFERLQTEEYRGTAEGGSYLKDLLRDILKIPREPEFWRRLLDLVGK